MRLYLMEQYRRVKRWRTPYLYPAGWAVVLGVAVGVPAAVGAGIALWCRYTIAGI